MTSDEIISFLVNSLSFKQDENEHSSFYKECPIGGDKLIVVRISNHRTYLQTWADRYKPTILPNKKVIRRMGENLPVVNRTKNFYSFVFEDKEDTVGNTFVKNGRKIKVMESVKKSEQFTIGMLNSFCAALKKLCSSNQYDSAALGDYEIVTTSTSNSNIGGNNNIKTENYMRNNKRTIRLTESDLHRVIKESVKRVLRETHRKNRRKSIYESFSGNDIEILQQNGLNPRMVQMLVSPQQVPVYNSDSDKPEWTNDFGISADNGDIRVWVNGAEVNELDDGLAVETIEDMCHDLNSGASVEDIWYDLTRNWSL